MHRAKWFAVLALTLVLAQSDAASGQPKATQILTATIRVLEVTGSPESRAMVDRFEASKRVAWRTGAGEEAIYQGTQESILKMKVHAEGPAGGDLVGALMRASEEDPQLGRPPMLWVSIPSMTFRGVLESVATRCDPKQCEAEIVVIQAQRALARAPQPASGTGAGTYEDPARSPGF
jgi:hypothetical protein